VNQLSATVILLSFLVAGAQAEEPIFFADAALKADVESALNVPDPTPTDMLSLTIFTAQNDGIGSTVGLEYAVNLWYLNLRLNNIQDVSPLSGLTNLTNLVLHKNPLADLSPLSGLTNLVYLDLNYTVTSDLSALASLTGLEELLLYGNSITDISALTTFTSLAHLDLRQNLLGKEAFEVHIPQLLANNPGINLQHDLSPCSDSYTVTLSSTTGGSVISPGEGTFACTSTSGGSRALRLEAKADPGFVFAAWTGTYDSTQNPTIVVVNRDHDICATFSCATCKFHVDDDAQDDPEPGNPDVSDPNEDGTVEHPFDSIQEAIDTAVDGVTILVQPGTYRENITISGKDIHLVGREPNDPNGTALPVIRANESGSVVLFVNEGDGSGSTFTGFAVTGGYGQAGMINCCDTTATISHCLIAGNRPTGYGSALIQCTDCTAAIVNCTIADNYMGACDAGLRAYNSAVTLTNSIFYHNTYKCSTGDNVIYMENGAEISLTYSDIAGGWPGDGNIDTDPLFARRGRWTDAEDPLVSRDPSDSNAVCLIGDYHLQSSAGRWDESTSSWSCDKATSPCIDAGDPATEIGCEPSPNGKIINMGVYGGTTEASKTP
jgi:hypothetical protein